MKMAKASDADLKVAMDLCQALESLGGRWGPVMPEAIARSEDGDESEEFDVENHQQCQRVIEHLVELAGRASLFRVVYGCAVMLDPDNKLVDSVADTIEHHPDRLNLEAAKSAKRLADYHEDLGAVLWWVFPISEPPYCGSPSDLDWPGYHTHWTPLILPELPEQKGEEEHQ